MQAVLRKDGLDQLRLRRSLAHDDYKADDLYNEWYQGRKTVLRFLSLVPDNCWLSVDALLEAVYDVQPGLLHTASDPSVWWLESHRTGRQFGTAFEDWRKSYGQFVLAVLTGPLTWLGIVRLGYSDPDAAETRPSTLDTPVSSRASDMPAAFQLTQTGSFALGHRTELSSVETATAVPTDPICSVSDSLAVIVVPDLAPLELHDLLHRVGRLVEVTPERFVYQLTAEGVLRWVDAGATAESGSQAGVSHSVEGLVALLSRYCESSDSNWAEKLRTWQRNRGLLHAYENITLVELADDYALQELLVSTSLADAIVYQFSPRLVAIKAHEVDHLVEEMETRGYTPRVQ
jgi:hypothetical protein